MAVIERIRAVAYCRYSSSNQHETSIEGQMRSIEEFCKKQNWILVSSYQDRAVSGTTDNREQFQKMISDSYSHKFERVVVYKLDRFARNRYDSIIYKNRLKKNDVLLCSVNENLTDSPESVILESLLEGMNEYYSKALSQIVMRGHLVNARNTVHNGGCCPLGYKLNDERKLEIEPHEAEAVRIIYQMYADGHGYSDIINYLNDNGYRTKKGNIFGKNSLHDILINLKYTGTFVYNRSSGLFCNKRNNHKNKPDNEMVRVPGGCPQIVSKELFEKVQARMSQNRRTGGRFHSKEFYLLTGKVFCGICGKRMQGNLRFAGRNKSRLATYRCNTHRSECKNKEINKDYLDVYIVDLLRQKIFNVKSLRRIIQKLNGYIKAYNSDYDKHYESVKTEYNAVCENLNNLTDAIEKGIVTESIISRAEKLEEQKNEIQNRLVNMHQFTPLEYKDFSPLIDEFKGLKRNTEEFRTFVQRYVNRITAFPYHLEIELNTGFGVTEELKYIVTIRRGELYALFDSRVKE